MAVQRLSNSGRSGFSYKSLIAGITPLPSVPTIGAATAVNFESVNVAFTAPGAYAGSTYTATSSPGGFTGTSATSPILVSGLSESTEYTFTVTATNATGTSGASAASDPVTTPSGDTGVMYPLGMVSVGSAGAANITFSSIPSTYTHLQIRCLVQANTSGNSALSLNYNSDTTASNYYRHALLGDGSSASTQAAQQFYAGSITDNAWAVNIIDILDYKNTSKYKTTRVLAGRENNSTGSVFFTSHLWMNTNAISTIVIAPAAANFIQYTSVALYGIKGA